MKNLISSTFLHPFFVGFVFCLPLLGGCQKNGLHKDSNTVPLSEIPENPDYALHPLVGTEWILIGFANTEAGSIRKVKHPDYEQGDYHSNNETRLYTLVFTLDGGLQGKASINTVSGSYIIDKDDGQKFTSIVLGSSTYAGEGPDGELYIDAINQTDRFSINRKGLLLYFESDNFLLFKPL
ncbi:META domain-containing protein [Parapedobacter sp.]